MTLRNLNEPRKFSLQAANRRKGMKYMRKYVFLAAAAAAAISTPAFARDGSPYVGLDAGIFFPESKDINGNIDFTNTAITDFGGLDRNGHVQAGL